MPSVGGDDSLRTPWVGGARWYLEEGGDQRRGVHRVFVVDDLALARHTTPSTLSLGVTGRGGGLLASRLVGTGGEERGELP